jgi:predicted small lipoprotein YifL
MKYSILVAAILAFFLVGCGEPKPGQYPPSQNILDDRDSANQE